MMNSPGSPAGKTLSQQLVEEYPSNRELWSLTIAFQRKQNGNTPLKPSSVHSGWKNFKLTKEFIHGMVTLFAIPMGNKWVRFSRILSGAVVTMLVSPAG